MSESSTPRSKRLLDPIDRVSEALFGLIMVLTFTCSLSAAEAGRAEVRAMLIGSLGCNLAWGIIDAILYLMGCLAEQGRGLIAWRAVRKAATPEEAHRIIADALPPLAASVLHPPELEAMRRKLNELPEPPASPRLRKDHWLAALSVFLWVFLITFPVVIPFLFMQDALHAMRVSNGVAIILLFLTGNVFGRCTGHPRPWLMGVGILLAGAALVAMTIALGG